MEMNFGESLKELLNNRKITPKELASTLHYSLSTIYSWLNNETDIRLSKLINLANFFNCSIEFLIGRDDNNSVNTFAKCPAFNERLLQVMKEKRISTYKLIKTTHYSSKHLYNWSHGTDPQLSTLIDLAKILDCTIDYLVGRI